MSWIKRNEAFRKIDKLVSEDPSLSDFLHQENVMLAIGQQSANIMKYILTHLPEMIEIAVGKVDTADEIERTISMAILTSNFTQITNELTRNRKIIKIITQSFFDADIQIELVLKIFQVSIERNMGDVLSLLENPVQLFSKLFQSLSHWAVFDFLISLMSNQTGTYTNFFQAIEIDVLLINNVYFEEIIAKRSLCLLHTIVVAFGPKSIMLHRLTRDKNLQFLLNFGLDAPTRPVAQFSFLILIVLNIKCGSTAYEDDSIQTMHDHLVATIRNNHSRICTYLKTDSSFFSDKRYCAELLKLLVDDVSFELTDDVVGTISYLFNMSINNKTNSFLHIAFKDLFQSFIKHEAESSAFIKDNNLYSFILKEEQQRDNNLATYWCLISALESCLKAPTDDQPDEWKQFIQGPFADREKIIKSPYGGSAPVANKSLTTFSSDRFGFNCHIFESYDALINGNSVHLPDSESSSSSSSESDSLSSSDNEYDSSDDNQD